MTEEFLDAIREKLGVAKKSEHWKYWVSRMDLKTCDECRKMHGKIYSAYDAVSDGPPRHFFCYCQIKPMDTVRAEDSTKQGVNGAPYWLKIYGCLPEYYVSDKKLQSLGWKWGKPPDKYAPGMMLTKGEYHNLNDHLPTKIGRIWYEADINYTGGGRNAQRVVWSNDGLIFITTDHYETFTEVI